MTLQSCILDNEGSQSEIVRKIDGLLENDMVFPLVCALIRFSAVLIIPIQRREITEREARIRELAANHSIVISQSAKSKMPTNGGKAMLRRY